MEPITKPAQGQPDGQKTAATHSSLHPHPFPFGHDRTKALVLAYYNALAAGDTDAPYFSHFVV